MLQFSRIQQKKKLSTLAADIKKKLSTFSRENGKINQFFILEMLFHRDVTNSRLISREYAQILENSIENWLKNSREFFIFSRCSRCHGNDLLSAL